MQSANPNQGAMGPVNLVIHLLPLSFWTALLQICSCYSVLIQSSCHSIRRANDPTPVHIQTVTLLTTHAAHLLTAPHYQLLFDRDRDWSFWPRPGLNWDRDQYSISLYSWCNRQYFKVTSQFECSLSFIIQQRFIW